MLAAFLSIAATAAPNPAASPNLLVVTIDTLRADRVGAYGHTAARTAALDRLAREGVLLEDAVVQVPQTRPSHATIFTGRYPYEHGIRDNAAGPLDASLPTLAAILKQRRYATAAFIGAYPVSRDSGLDRGFDVFDDPFAAGESVATREDRSERRAAEVVDRAVEWLARPRQAPFFVWVHLFDPHAPYEAPAPYAQRFAKAPYDGEVAYSDAQVARLLEQLDHTGQAETTLVVVTSDHGEGLGDHGEDEHLFFVYDTTLRVPLLLRWPGRLPKAARVGGQFRSVDLLPSLLDLLGVPAPATSGVSRAAALRSGARLPDSESYAESLYASLHFGYAPLRSLRAEGWKFIDAPRAELYRVSEDPGETRNLAELRQQVAAAMRARLVTYDRAGAPAASKLDAAAAERLAALGYISGGFFQGTPSGADPKDKIQEFQAYRRDVSKAVRLFRAGDFDAAIRLLTRLAEPSTAESGQLRERRSFNVDYYLGRSLLELRRFKEAIAPLERAVALSPKSVPAYVFLSRAHGGAGRAKDALSTVERGLHIAPANAELHQMKGRLVMQQGDAAAARTWLEKARSLDPKNALVHVDLATLYRNARELPRARQHAQEAVRLAPESPEAHVAQGMVSGAEGRSDAAAAAFRTALKHAPDHPDALFFLAAVELGRARGDVAQPLLERLLKSLPDYPGARDALAAAKRQAAPIAPGSARLRLLRTRTRARAEEAARRAAAGDDFATVARELSEDASAGRGGDLGIVALAELKEPLRSAAAGLAPGQVSAIVETPAGFVLLKRER